MTVNAREAPPLTVLSAIRYSQARNGHGGLPEPAADLPAGFAIVHLGDMTVAREELHHLVDELDEETVPSATELLRELAARRSRQRTRPSWLGALQAGPDFAERSEEILRTELGRSA